MTTPPLRFNAVTSQDRHETTQRVRRAISDSNGWLTDFRAFSNFAVVLEIEVSTTRFPGMLEAIEATGIVLSPTPSEVHAPPEQEEVRCTLRIAFDHDEPELIIPVPDVPG